MYVYRGPCSCPSCWCSEARSFRDTRVRDLPSISAGAPLTVYYTDVYVFSLHSCILFTTQLFKPQTLS